MGNSFIGHGEFSKVETNHFRLNLNLGESLTVVDVDDGLYHIREDDAVSQVGLDGLWLVKSRAVLLDIDEFLDELAVSRE
jgi:hypothetical protein